MEQSRSIAVSTSEMQTVEADDLKRIVALPRRSVVDCSRRRDASGNRVWAPEAQALIEIVTARYAKAARLSCGCRRRTLVAGNGGQLTVFQAARRDGEPPPPPLYTTIASFCADNAHDEELVRAVSAMRPGAKLDLAGLGHPVCLTQLNPVQSWTLWELPRAGGAFGMVSVGGGKTILGILAPLAINCRQAVILIKPDQRIHYRNAYLRLREHFRVPSITFDRVTDVKGSYIVDGAPVLHVIPYSTLSNPKSTQLLESIAPDMIIADESHLLANKSSTRTMRFLRYLTDHSNVIFCNWSGSTVKKSMKDASHLAAHSLGIGSPYPIMQVETWSQVIDPIQAPDRISSTAKKLWKAFGTRAPGQSDKKAEELFEMGFLGDGGIREGHRERIIQTPGVISTRSSSVTCSLTFHERKIHAIPKTVSEVLPKARLGIRPDGEELAEQSEIQGNIRNVASGFHYYWAYPKGEPEELILDWFEKRKAWNKELRAKLLNGEPHLDSPFLCANAAERAYRVPRYDGNLPVWPAVAWLDWAAIKDQVQPDPRVKWVDDFLARDAAMWAKEHRGIVWCQSSAFGRRVAELAGIRYHGGGPEAEARLLAEDGSQSIVCSIKAHSQGRDGLQFKFSKQLVAEMISSADGWEQLLGRTAREGQSEDTVDTWVYLHVTEMRDALRKAIMLAEFVEATTPNEQLLLAADVEFDL